MRPTTTPRVRAAGSVAKTTPLLRGSLVVLAVLTAASWMQVLAGTPLGEVLSREAASGAATFVGQLAGLRPAGAWRDVFADAERWRFVGGLAMQTLAMSVLAIVMAAAGMLLTVIMGARRSPLGGRRSRSRAGRAVLYGIRALYVFTRAVPELIWALLIVFVLTPGILPGAIALGLHNFGILGKLCSEVVEDLDPRPARALRAAGARSGQVLAYAVLPRALPQFLTFTLYRWEVVIRTTILVGFVGAGGLGQEFRLAMSFFHYAEVGQLLVVYFLLVIGVDGLSSLFRRLVRA